MEQAAWKNNFNFDRQVKILHLFVVQFYLN